MKLFHHRPAIQRTARAFTLLEVLIAFAVFFIAVFAILALVTQSLGTARHLNQVDADISSLASTLSMTSPLAIGDSLPPEVQSDFEESHPGYTCYGNIEIAGTNGLLRINLEIHDSRSSSPASTMSILLFRPESANAIGGPALRGPQ